MPKKTNYDTLPKKKTIKEINDCGRKINLLFDFSNIMYRKIYGLQNELARNAYQDFRVLQHAVIDNILQIQSNYRDANVVICIDKKRSDGRYWRHDIFPYYKNNRKNAKDMIPKDVRIRETKNIINLLKDQLPWKVVEVDRLWPYPSSDRAA